VLPLHKVVAFLAYEPKRVQDKSDGNGESVIDGVAVVHAETDTLANVIRSLGVNLIVIGFDTLHDAVELYPVLRRLRFEGIEVLTPLNVSEVYKGKTPLDQVDEEWLLQATMESGLPLIRQTKRLIDIVVSILGLLLGVIPAIVVALAIKMSSPKESAIYTQIRIGQFGEPFRIFKFRTMHEGAEDGSGPVWSKQDDSRITRIGKGLRKCRFDELPQIINVFKGDMSIVGPRPERPEMVASLSEEIPYFNERENVMPGLTGWAQIRHPYGESVEDAKQKLEYDLYYMKNLSLSLDLQIILSTIRIVLLGKERRI
jgi:exopolysaccharide biosynthesis polyprenyl glycosylphosphotransferase